MNFLWLRLWVSLNTGWNVVWFYENILWSLYNVYGWYNAEIDNLIELLRVEHDAKFSGLLVPLQIWT